MYHYYSAALRSLDDSFGTELISNACKYVYKYVSVIILSVIEKKIHIWNSVITNTQLQQVYFVKTSLKIGVIRAVS